MLQVKNFSLVTLCAVLLSVGMHAAEPTAFVDDIVYTLDYEHRTAEVAANPKTSGELTIPEQIKDGAGRSYTVVSLSENAFKGCKSLTSIVLPKTLRRLYRSSLEGTGVYANRDLWKDGALYIDGCLIAVDKSIPKPKFVVADGTRVIAGSAFQGNKVVTAVVIPSSVSRIDVFTFKDCKNLQKVTFGSHITSIGRDAFTGCGIYANDKKWKKGILYIDSCLVAVNKELPAKVTYKTPYRLIAEGVFAHNSTLQSVELSPLLEQVPAACFYECANLKTVKLPAGLKEIGAFAFYRCALLRDVQIPAGVTRVGAGAFYECSALPALTLPDGVEIIGKGCFFGCKQFTAFPFPKSLKLIGDGAFAGCVRLESIKLPAGLEDLGKQCFAGFKGCGLLERIAIPDRTFAIGKDAFNGCASLEQVSLGEDLHTIDNGAFADCKRIEQIVIPDAVTIIGAGAFAGCYGLRKLQLPKNLEQIDREAFRDCRALREVKLPKRLVKIGARAFASCKQLREVTLPNHLEQLGEEAFRDCEMLPSLLLALPDDCIVGKNAFKGCKE